MFPFVVDHRSTFEPSLAIYHASRKAFKSSSRGQNVDDDTPPAYTPRKATSSSISSTSSTSSAESKRSRLSRLNPFSRLRRTNTSTISSDNLSPTTTTTSSAASSQHASRRPRKSTRVHFEDSDDAGYASDGSSSSRDDSPPPFAYTAELDTKPAQKGRRRAPTTIDEEDESWAWAEGRAPGQHLGYPRAVDDNMMRCFWMGI